MKLKIKTFNRGSSCEKLSDWKFKSIRGVKMLKKFFVFSLLASVALTGFADVMDNFKTGGMEFGGDLMINYRPDYAVFNSDDRDAEEGGFDLIIEGSANIGIFLIDNLSLSFIPTLFYLREKNNNGDGTFDIRPSLQIGFNMGAAYYVNMGGSFVLSPGLETGITFIPGMDRIIDDIEDPNDSLDIAYSLKPTFSAYYFMGENLAPYIKIGTNFSYYRDVKNSDGSDYEYVSDYSFMDHVYLNITTTIGFKYFLPVGSRFLSGKSKNIVEILDSFAK